MYPFKGMEFLFIGFAAGFAHVISGVDHLAALAPFAARREQHAAWRLGLHWGLGHACGVALIGLLVWLLKGTTAAEWLSYWDAHPATVAQWTAYWQGLI